MPTLTGVSKDMTDSLKAVFKAKPQDDQMHRLKEVLEKLPIRIAVLLDDMDRMRKDELGIILKLVRGAVEFSNLTFVCAFDKDSLLMELDVETEFLEKFFPVQIPLPKVDFGVLAEEFNRKFERLCKQNNLLAVEKDQKEFNDRFEPLWRKHIRQNLSNLRKLKLFFNKIASTIGPIVHEINPFDFLLIELVRENAPEIYDRIYREGGFFFYARWTIETWPERPPFSDATEQQDFKRYYDGLLQGIEGEKREMIQGLLEALFPRFRKYTTAGSLTEPDPIKSFSERRIYHPYFFPRYFIFSVPSDQFGEAEFHEFTTALAAEKNAPGVTSEFREKFAGLQSGSLKRLHFLERLSSSMPTFGEVIAEGLATGVAQVSKQLEGDSFIGESADARRIVLGTAKTQTSDVRRLNFLEEIINSAESDSFAAELVRFFIGTAEKDRAALGLDKVEATAIKNYFRNRMKDKYQSGGGKSLFEEEKNPVQTLFVWFNCGEEAQKEEREVLAREFEEKPQVIGKLINLVAWPGHPSYEGEVGALDKLFPLPELKRYLDKYGDRAFSTPEEEKAIQKLKERFVSVPQVPSNPHSGN